MLFIHSRHSSGNSGLCTMYTMPKFNIKRNYQITTSELPPPALLLMHTIAVY